MSVIGLKDSALKIPYKDAERYSYSRTLETPSNSLGSEAPRTRLTETPNKGSQPAILVLYEKDK
jgi:hypothetical protein